MADMHIDLFDAYHYAAETTNQNYIATNTDPPPLWERGKRKPPPTTFTFTRGLERKEIVSSLHFMQNTLIYSRNKPQTSWKIYVSIDFMVAMPLTLQTGRPKQHYFEKQPWQIVISSQNKLSSQGSDVYTT